ncbi:hypothetical protein MPL3356_390179 [Mesorhizobium plurifarium]|uniref:Uncharacterized protein n=1 Tax=Mesorhizobium plurifarium TaxID=69974 RepID=A0A090FTB5_MESPL|nr:hypothetical protein MPL3356_390179 [Mesorhizobium plurifarium]
MRRKAPRAQGKWGRLVTQVVTQPASWRGIDRTDFTLKPLFLKWSEWRDSNTRPPDPKSGALPGCATLRRPAAYRGLTPGRQHKNGRP